MEYIGLQSPVRVIDMGTNTLAAWEYCHTNASAYTRRQMRRVHALYCFDVFRGNACWDAALQWRLATVGLDGLRAKSGRCDNNCVFNGAG